MLTFMGVCVAACLIWFGVVQPSLAWNTAAADRRVRAAEALSSTRTSLLALKRDARAPVANTAGLEPVVVSRAQSSGLEITTAMSASGALGFRSSRAETAALFAWLAALEDEVHLTVCELAVAENADATLNVEGALSAGACGA